MFRTPTTKPIKSIHELAKWERGHDPFNVASIPLQPRPSRSSDPSASLNGRPDVPRTMLCHDMAGGYKEDAFPQGLQHVTDVYNFQYWTYVDEFICE
jgi:hypothetical protein